MIKDKKINKGNIFNADIDNDGEGIKVDDLISLLEAPHSKIKCQSID